MLLQAERDRVRRSNGTINELKYTTIGEPTCMCSSSFSFFNKAWLLQ